MSCDKPTWSMKGRDFVTLPPQIVDDKRRVRAYRGVCWGASLSFSAAISAARLPTINDTSFRRFWRFAVMIIVDVTLLGGFRGCECDKQGWAVWRTKSRHSARERYVFVHVFYFCASGWGPVLSSFFLAGKVCFVFLCSEKNLLWTPS